MTNEILERFRDMNDETLMHCAAFEMYQYSKEAQGQVAIVLREQSISDDSVKSYRAEKFPVESYDFECPFCGEQLTADKEDLVEGKFNCPECGVNDWIPYPEISPEGYIRSSASTSETQTPSRGSRKSSEELSLNPLSPLFQLGESDPQIVSSDSADDGRILPEGLPETRCAKCGIVLTPEQTFLVDEDFYCEKCVASVAGTQFNDSDSEI